MTFFTYEEASETKGKKPLLAEIVEPASKHWSNQVSNALNTSYLVSGILVSSQLKTNSPYIKKDYCEICI